MYTKKQRAMFSGLCYALGAWLCASMIASVVVAVYLSFAEEGGSAAEISGKYQLVLFLVAGAPAFMIGYDKRMKE